MMREPDPRGGLPRDAASQADPQAGDGRVPDWLVERLAADDLPDAQARSVRARLAARGELARLDAIADADRAFLAAHPPGVVADELARRARTDEEQRARARRRRLLSIGSPLVLAAAAIAVWLGVRPAPTPPRGEREDSAIELTTSKGLAPQLRVYRKTASGAARLADRARVAAGDTIQLAYVAAGRPYGVIASIDARGEVTLHLPEDRGVAWALGRGETPLPHAFVLDDAPGFERFVFVTSEQPFATDAVVAALRTHTPLPPSVTASELTLEKDLP